MVTSMGAWHILGNISSNRFNWIGIYLDFLFYLWSFLVSCIFKVICLFHPNFQIYWCKIIHSICLLFFQCHFYFPDRASYALSQASLNIIVISIMLHRLYFLSSFIKLLWYLSYYIGFLFCLHSFLPSLSLFKDMNFKLIVSNP